MKLAIDQMSQLYMTCKNVRCYNPTVELKSTYGTREKHNYINSIPSFFPAFLLPDVMSDHTDVIWRKGIKLEKMTGRTAPSSDSLLSEGISGVFLSCKANTSRSVHRPRIISLSSLSLADWHDWFDAWGKWPLARNPDRSWWFDKTSEPRLLVMQYRKLLHYKMDTTYGYAT